MSLSWSYTVALARRAGSAAATVIAFAWLVIADKLEPLRGKLK